MPKYVLSLKAELENLTNLQPNGSNYEWSFKVVCTNCREEKDGFVQFNAEDEVPLPTGRGEVNFVMKCPGCKSVGNATILKETLKPYTKSGQFQPIVTIESRGMDFVGWQPTHGQSFKAEGEESGTTFDDIEFEDGTLDWVGYDDEGKCPVGVTEIEGKFDKGK
ncbi:hypothetical protein HDU76_012681 [Blyttiomyces sp. JEL0837]|nr:hypothetical protein HDU76_012681 [Blyttiomyces sp. JEL0837]